MLLGSVAGLWQLLHMGRQAEEIARVEREVVAVVRVHASVLALRHDLERLAEVRDAETFEQEAHRRRTRLLSEIEQALAALRQDDGAAWHDDPSRMTLETLRLELSHQVDGMIQLARTGEWPAVHRRLRQNVREHVGGFNILIERLDRSVGARRDEALATIRAGQRRAVTMLSLTTALTLLSAAGLAWLVTSSLTGRLRRLEAGALAVAAGDFEHRVALGGGDELSSFSMVFDHMADRVGKAYEILSRAKEEAEASAAEARRLAEAMARANRQLEQEVGQRRRTEAALRDSEERFRQLTETIEAVFWMIDVDTSRLLYVSPAYETIWGRAPEDLGSDLTACLESIHDDDRTRIAEAFRERLTESLDEEFRIVRGDGGVRWIRMRSFPVRDLAGRVHRVVGISQDVTDRKTAEDAIRHWAYHDQLTGLPNRLLFADRCTQALDHARRTGGSIAILFLEPRPLQDDQRYVRPRRRGSTAPGGG